MKFFIKIILIIFFPILLFFWFEGRINIFAENDYSTYDSADIFLASASEGIGHNLLLTPWDGDALYDRYCLTCHGDTGTGDGPAAKVLPQPPIQLKDSLILKNYNDFKKYINANKPIEAVKEITHYTQNISDDELKKLTHYIVALKKVKRHQPPSYTNITYTTSCIFCHGFLADGKGVIKNFLKKEAYNFRSRKAKKLTYKNWLKKLKASQKKMIRIGKKNPHFFRIFTPDEGEKLFKVLNKFLKNNK